jgi:hypothetical protein
MTKLKTDDSEGKKSNDEAAQAARERELLDLIEQVEKEQSGNLPPKNESPHEFIERKMRERTKK